MAAPQIKINGGAAGVKASLSAATAFTATLDSTAGVKQVEWAVLSTDETSAVDDYTLVQSGTVGQTVATTSLAAGTAGLLWVRVNAGVDAQTGIADATTTTATCKFYVPCAGGSEVGAAGEKMESDPTYGSTALLNRGIRAADALNVGQYDATYIVRTAVALLPNATAADDITSTVEFVSTSAIPFGTKRTDSATAALVDVEQVTAISSGTAAAGFGPALKFIGEVSGGGAENYGRVGFAATDLTGGSEDTKAVLQARTAGAALATVAEFSGTAVSLPGIATGVAGILAIDGTGGVTRTASSAGADATAKYVTDNATVVNANDVPLQAMTGTLEFKSTARPVGFAHETAAAGTTEIARHRRTITAAAAGLTGTGGYDSWWIPDGAGTEVEAFRLNARWNQVVGPYAEVAFSFNSNGSLTERIVLSSAGAITTPGIITGANFVGVSLDRATGGALTLGGTNATSVAGSGLPFTGVLSIDNSGAGLTIGANTTSQTFGKAGTTATFLGANTLTEATTLSALTTGVVHAGLAGLLSSSTIVNADVSASAAIDGTKIAPSFGAQSISQTGATSITAGSVGFIGAVLDNSGGTLTVGGNTTAQTFGKASTTFALLGDMTVAGTAIHSGLLTVQLDALGTTKTRAIEVGNATVSGSQVSGQIGVHASHSGSTRHNFGLQIEPQSASNALSVWYYGTGTGAPSSTAFYHASSDGNFGSAMFADAWVCRSTSSTGFRFDKSNNRGGLKHDSGDDWIFLESYNTKGLRLKTGADSGGTGGVVRIFVDGNGKGRAVFVCSAPTSASNAVTFDLSASQNIEHALTENTTVTFTGATAGMHGIIAFKQDGTGRTVTMPANGTGIEYDAAILALTTTGIVDTTAAHRTVLAYYVLSDVANRIYVYARSTSVIP